MSDDIHVLPIGDKSPEGKPHREHRRCWCEPRIEWPCDECVGDPKCWRCKGKGLLTEPTALAALVTHNAQDGRK